MRNSAQTCCREIVSGEEGTHRANININKMTPARVGGGLLISLYPTEHPTARPSFVRQMMLSKTLLLALLGTSTVTALKKQPRSALRLRGGGVDATQIATGLAYVSSGFILLPAGRDIVSHSTNLLPGEDTTRPLMMAAHPSARAFTWGLWGVNHCFIAVLKLLAIKNDDKAMLKLLTASALATTFYCIKGQQDMTADGGDVGGFIAVCAVQAATLGYLAFA